MSGVTTWTENSDSAKLAVKVAPEGYQGPSPLNFKLLGPSKKIQKYLILFVYKRFHGFIKIICHIVNRLSGKPHPVHCTSTPTSMKN